MIANETVVKLLEQLVDEVKGLREDLRGRYSGSMVRGPSPSVVAPVRDEVQAETPEDGVGVRKGDEAEQFLGSIGVDVKVRREAEPGQEFLDKIAFYMGDRFDTLKKAIALLKRNVQCGQDFKMSLVGETQVTVSNVCQLFSRLHDLAYLQKYNYRNSPYFQIFAKTSPEPKVQNFITGGWLERYALKELQESYAEIIGDDPEMRLDYLANPQVSLPDGDDFELDVLGMVGNKPVWIEAKTGDYQTHVAKYTRIANRLGLKDRLILLLSACNEQECMALSMTYGIRVANCRTLKRHLAELLGEQMAPETWKPRAVA